ncbi:hypothetical protein NHX12_013053 [Muraenolepis orangiensis]|uniref:Uncharacterized protein n=1 Tax=Muraenolepis orangiensis TaxID=630683 RepID=A0A9Q0DE76_9TELE|nr:hypothetical protein NHX12_013053 [Muraenolepis orangiensis]
MARGLFCDSCERPRVQSHVTRRGGNLPYGQIPPGGHVTERVSLTPPARHSPFKQDVLPSVLGLRGRGRHGDGSRDIDEGEPV